MNVHVFIPCFVDQLYPTAGFNTIKVLEKAGCNVIYNPEQTCCGQPAFNAGYWGESRDVCSKFIKDFEQAEYVVMPSASCTGFVNNYYDKVFGNTSNHNATKDIKGKVFELSDFLVNVLKVVDLGASLNGTATYHDSCAALRECKIKEEPRTLLKHVKGLNLVPLQENETCCGFGGTFAVKFEGISTAMGEQKAQHVMDTKASYLISTDLSCLMHINGVMEKKQMPVQCLHLADVLASGY
jgi:L-lactate dehydrogenase complex protein LldE